MAADWHVKTFPDPMVALGPTGQMHDAIFNLAAAHGGNAGTMAVFSHHNLRTNEVTWYFSPQAAPVAKLFQATPCEKPEPMAGLAFSAGAAGAWGIHFPGFTPHLD